MSTLKVNTIADPDNGNTAITIDSSGNATFSGNVSVSGTLPAAQLTGTLPAIDGSALTGITTGITHMTMFRASISANYLNGSTIDANWEIVDDANYSDLGATVSESSGIFSLPTTGFWRIDFYTTFQLDTTPNADAGFYMQTSNNSGSTWDTVVYQFHKGYDRLYPKPLVGHTVTDCTDTSTFRVRVVADTGGGQVRFYGNTNFTYTGITFTRLGDT